ncbi:MAG: hypothetical protein NXH97_21615 [Rhodobacteraceae bacterium]|nr:hypothetical protein [Paracoccaceae bacterium]
MSTLSPVTADPGAIAVALMLPDGAGVQPGGAQLFLGARRTDTGAETGLSVALARRSDGEVGEVFEIAPGDRAAFRAEQARIAAWQAEAPDATKGTLSMAVAPCRVGTGPAPRARSSVAIRFAPDEPFSPLLRDVPLSRIANESDIAAWPPCGDGSSS